MVGVRNGSFPAKRSSGPLHDRKGRDGADEVVIRGEGELGITLAAALPLGRSVSGCRSLGAVRLEWGPCHQLWAHWGLVRRQGACLWEHTAGQGQQHFHVVPGQGCFGGGRLDLDAPAVGCRMHGD